MTTHAERIATVASRACGTAAGGSIVYENARGIVSISRVIFGRTEFQVEDSSGVRIEHSDMDFIFPAASLIVNLEAVVPQRGDRITIAGREETYEVLAPAGEQVYRDTGYPGAAIRRVHTKRLR
jgi:hypothetical protein